jgi:nucleoside-triphosphatase THEP1
LDVEDVSTGHRRPLAERFCATDGPTTESWHFHADGLAWGASVLCRATLCDLLVIDELGPLELVQDKGWTVGLDLLRDSRYRLTLVVVRPALLPRLQERLGGVDLLVLPVTEINRGDVSGEILTLLESQEVR